MDAISGLLNKAGFDVSVARNGTDALAMIRDEPPDLVTLDLTLPDIDGVEVCRQVRLVSDATSSWSADAPPSSTG